jgi:UDP-N-acetylglucosamine diphosphorylase/glucosamine-1-phosphate N-acetyltransferase
VIILAAGKGKRMLSKIPKVLHDFRGIPMISSVINNALKLNPEKLILVLGYKSKQVKEVILNHGNLGNVDFVYQKKQLGTGHAISVALPNLTQINGDVIVLSADVPLLSSKTLKKLLQRHKKGNFSATMLTTIMNNPTGYGRVLRDKEKKCSILGIVEQKDALPEELEIAEVNTGTYAFRTAFLRENLPKLKNNNAQNEYYLTDIFKLAICNKKLIGSIQAKNTKEVMGVNTPEDLKNLELS